MITSIGQLLMRAISTSEIRIWRLCTISSGSSASFSQYERNFSRPAAVSLYVLMSE